MQGTAGSGGAGAAAAQGTGCWGLRTAAAAQCTGGSDS